MGHHALRAAKEACHLRLRQPHRLAVDQDIELKLASGRSPYELLTVWEVDPKTQKSTQKGQKPISPFHSAMITRNPPLPPQEVDTSRGPLPQQQGFGVEGVRQMFQPMLQGVNPHSLSESSYRMIAASG